MAKWFLSFPLGPLHRFPESRWLQEFPDKFSYVAFTIKPMIFSLYILYM